jgi:hypothetical protein
MVCAALKIDCTTDDYAAIIAKKVIALAMTGEHDPDQLCEKALNDLRGT